MEKGLVKFNIYCQFFVEILFKFDVINQLNEHFNELYIYDPIKNCLFYFGNNVCVVVKNSKCCR